MKKQNKTKNEMCLRLLMSHWMLTALIVVFDFFIAAKLMNDDQ